ncbi:MAG: hypothetical protein GWP10_17370 [Nitrospiraceae bacterium]|nr:hypothetical protein [Nitrospiraceae bacterium]
MARTVSYLKWRYLDHPDYDYTLILVCKWGQPVGWWLGRVEGNTLLIGDALFDPEATYAPQIGLISWLRLLQRSEAGFPGIRSGGQSSCTDWASGIKGSIRIWISALPPFLRCLLENFLK